MTVADAPIPPQHSRPHPGGPGPHGGPPSGPMDMPRLSLPMMLYFRKFLVGQNWKLAVITVTLILAAAYNPMLAKFPSYLGKHWSVGDRHAVWAGLFGLTVLFLVSLFCSFYSTYLSMQVRESFTQGVRLTLFSKIGSLPTTVADQQSVGSLAYRSADDVRRIAELLAPALSQIFMAAVQALLTLILLATLGWWWFFWALLLVPAVLFGTSAINFRVQTEAQRMQAANEDVMTSLIEGLGGHRDLVVMGRFEDAVTRYDQRLRHLRKLAISTFTWNGAAVLVPLLAGNLLVFAFYFTKISSGLGNPAALGNLIAGSTLLAMLPMPVIQLTQAISQVAMAAPSFMKIRQWLEMPDTVQGPESAVINSTGFKIDNVCFRHTPQAPLTLENLSLNIEPDKFTAIVGQSGCGKTTLFSLLLRLMEPESGQILLGDVPLPSIPLKAFRNLVGFIPQAPFIFDLTLRENLTIGVPPDQVTEERVRAAMEIAQMQDLLGKRGANDLDMRVGPGGYSLSAGERQRIALARVVIRDPQIIICDEYTANIDNATAKLIQEAIAKNFAGRTRIVITHQLHMVRGADKIIVLDKGKVVDQGTYAELISRPGLFREMWEVQRVE